MFPAAPRPTLSENKWNYVSYASLMLNCFLVRYWYINTGILDTDRKHDNLNGWNSVFKIRERSDLIGLNTDLPLDPECVNKKSRYKNSKQETQQT